MTAYIRKLEQLLDADPDKERRPKSDLETRVSQWYLSIPEISRQRPFAMVELEKALGTQGKYLSPILLELGWRRGRKWSSQGQYNRYWVPPPS